MVCVIENAQKTELKIKIPRKIKTAILCLGLTQLINSIKIPNNFKVANSPSGFQSQSELDEKGNEKTDCVSFFQDLK